MKVARWTVAFLVTAGAFTVVTWLGGAVLLMPLLKDAGVRWGVAGAAGVAIAALVAMWGQSYATEAPSQSETHGGSATRPAAPATGAGSTRNKISGGTFHGPVIQARDVCGLVLPPQSPDTEAQPEAGG